MWFCGRGLGRRFKDSGLLSIQLCQVPRCACPCLRRHRPRRRQRYSVSVLRTSVPEPGRRLASTSSTSPPPTAVRHSPSATPGRRLRPAASTFGSGRRAEHLGQGLRVTSTGPRFPPRVGAPACPTARRALAAAPGRTLEAATASGRRLVRRPAAACMPSCRFHRPAQMAVTPVDAQRAPSEDDGTTPHSPSVALAQDGPRRRRGRLRAHRAGDRRLAEHRQGDRVARRTQGGSGGGGARSARYPGGGGTGGGRSRAVDPQAGALPHVRKAGRRRRKGTKPGAATHISAGHMSASFRGRYTRCVLAVVAGVALGACWQVPPAVALGAFLQTGVSVRTERCRRSWRDTRRVQEKRGARCGLRPDRRRA